MKSRKTIKTPCGEKAICDRCSCCGMGKKRTKSESCYEGKQHIFSKKPHQEPDITPELAHFARGVLVGKREGLEWLLEHASGNWRRVALQEINRLKK